MSTIRVKSGLPGNQTALWEKHPAHPDGETPIIAGDGIYEVGYTSRVRDYLRSGRLIEVVATPKPDPDPPAPDTTETEDEADADAVVETEPDPEPEAAAPTKGKGRGKK